MVLSSGLAAADYPKLQYFVTDQVGVLSDSNVSDIEDVCIEVQQKRGAEMAVLIVNTTAPDAIDTYALKTFERSALGQKGKDNGVLLVVATGDRTWRVEVGYGLEGVLPDSFVGHIADEYLVPYLNASDYYDGILYTTAFLGQEIITNYTAGSPPKQAAPAHYPISWLPCTAWELVLIVVVVVGLMVVTRGRFIWWIPLLLGRGGGGSGGGGSGGRSGGGGASGKW
jgi:uncharacterized protein